MSNLSHANTYFIILYGYLRQIDPFYVIKSTSINVLLNFLSILCNFKLENHIIYFVQKLAL